MFKAFIKYRLMYKEKAITRSGYFYILKRNISPFRRFLSLKVMMAVTYKCQCSCDYCGISGYDTSREELNTSAFKTIIKDIAKLPYFLICLSFFGGEPLLRQDLFELIDFAKRKGLLCELDSNGILLDADKLRRLKAAGLNHIFISLDNTDAAKQDKIKGKAGCFKAAVDSISNAVGIGLSCSVSVCATSQNIHDGEIEKIIRLARGLKVKSVRILPVVGQCRRLSEEELAKLKKLLEPDFVYLESTSCNSAFAGKSCAFLRKEFFYISPYADVQPCPYSALCFGNIRENSLKSIVNSMWGKFDYDKYVSVECLDGSRKVQEDIISKSGAYYLSVKSRQCELAD